ncbi:leucine-rich repeat-containing protein 53 [Pyrgilauda ruficollis]|uniref:leucine-rich repeat-containing protein 53 n=1 Tax=Pyrgilauda ruficollis TaxID=221976 RepID=UPI001B87E6CD|nr:leucine-rich repeat-containing protein 53 [Pyrgilauda ruficollis]
MEVLALTLVTLLALLPPAEPCSSEMNKVKDLLEVNCTGQALIAVPPDLPADTGILLLSDNRLESLSTTAFLSLAQLQDIDLTNNGLVALHTGALLLSLKELTLSHNALAALPVLEGLPALTHLAVAHNSLETLAPGAFRTVPQLQNLDLRGNKMQQLPQEAFAGLRALKELDLSDNLLKELPKELLQDLQKLETLWLSGNKLQTLPTDFFPKGRLFMYVFLTENPWHCNCDLHYLQTWIQKNADIVYQPERGLEETKVEVAPEKVLCHSPAEHRQKPIIHFKLNCSIVEDEDEEGGDEYNYGEETIEKATMTTFPLHTFISKAHTTMPCAITSSCLSTLTTTRSPLTRPSLCTPCTTTFSPNTLLVVLTSIRAPSTTIPVPASLTVTPTQTPSTATILTAATTITLHRPATFNNVTSLPTTMSSSSSSTSGHPPTTLATSSIYGSLMGSTGTFPTTSTAMPSTAMLEASSIVRSPCPPLMSANTKLFTHAPTLPPLLDTTHFTQPACSPLPAPPPLCPCSIPGRAVPVLHLQAGGEALQWGQWVLRHCCLLHWVLYLASLALLVLTMLALAGWLAWMCLVGQPSWHQALQTLEVRYPLLEWRDSTGNPMMHLSSFKIPLQKPTFCTIKEVDLCPEVTYCTIKDLGTQCSPPASYSFCTTKELWVHHSPLHTSVKPFSRKMMVTDLSFLRTPSAYSLDRGVEAIGDVRVKYAGNTM